MWVCKHCGNSGFRVEEEIVLVVEREIVGDIQDSGLINLKIMRNFKNGVKSNKVKSISIVCNTCEYRGDFGKGIQNIATKENIKELRRLYGNNNKT